MGFDLGARLRAIRERHGLSQRGLGKRSGVTNATISLIEQNRVNPSVGSLKKVLDGIPMSLSEFFETDESDADQVFFEAAELIELAGGPISYRQVGRRLRGRALQILHERLAAGADSGTAMLHHQGEEGGVVVKGLLEVTVGDQRRVLGVGDAYYFRSTIPHRFRNPGEEECEIVSACTPPSF